MNLSFNGHLPVLSGSSRAYVTVKVVLMVCPSHVTLIGHSATRNAGPPPNVT